MSSHLVKTAMAVPAPQMQHVHYQFSAVHVYVQVLIWDGRAGASHSRADALQTDEADDRSAAASSCSGNAASTLCSGNDGAALWQRHSPGV